MSFSVIHVLVGVLFLTVLFLPSDLSEGDATTEILCIETVEYATKFGLSLSMELDEADQPHFAYYDSSKKDLKYATWSGNHWQIETVDTDGDVGQYASLTGMAMPTSVTMMRPIMRSSTRKGRQAGGRLNM